MESKERAIVQKGKSILILTPVFSDIDSTKMLDALGRGFASHVPKVIDGQVIYAGDVKGLAKSLKWKNLVRNGSINVIEARSIAKTIGCESVMTCRVVEYKKYPPFKMIVSLMWIDVGSGDIISKAYNTVDLLDTETNIKFGTFAGHSPVRKVYEEFTYNSGRQHAASLSPTKFAEFAAGHSTQALFTDLYTVPWYKFWQIQ